MEQLTRHAVAYQPLLFAPSELLAVGLADAHTRPLVSPGKRADGSLRSWRTSPDRAWGYPLLEWGRTATSTAALILDCDSREAIERGFAVTMGYGDLPRPSVTIQRKKSEHLQLAWMLRRPVHRYPGARSKPRQLLARVAEFYTEHVGADAGFVGVLSSNPVHGDYSSTWRDDANGLGFDLPDLAAAIPSGWRRPTRAADLQTEAGRNCHLFAALCKLALRCTDDGLLTHARTLNREFHAPLPDGEVRGIWLSVCRYRARWRVQGHNPAWLARQAARSAKQLGKARKASLFPDMSNEQAKPWADLGVSRRTWYYRRKSEAKGAGRKVALSPIQIDRVCSGSCPSDSEDY